MHSESQSLSFEVSESIQSPCKYRPDSSVGKASAFGAGGCGFETRPHHTKGVKKMVLAAPLLSKAGKYLLNRYCYVAIKALQSVSHCH